MVKLTHVVAFFLLASFTQHLTARDLEIKVNDGLDAFQLDVSQSGCPGVTKERWPELLGVPAKLAKEVIQKDNPKLTNVPTVLNGSPVTADLRCDRVRLFVNILNFVVQIPMVG